MKNLQTGTTCLSSSTGSKQHKCRRSLQRLATFVILFLCSMTIAWAEGTTDKNFGFTQTSKTDLEHQSKDEAITATFSNTSPRLNTSSSKKNGTGTLTITANAATISKVNLLVSKSNKETSLTAGIDAIPKTTGITVEDCQMPVTWSADNKKVVFNCSTTKDLYVYGATITYKDDDAGKLSLNEVSDPTITLNSTTTTEKLSFTINQTAKTQTGTSLKTYYTTDGSNPNDENGSRVTLTQNPQTVTIDWVKGNTVKVRTFTKRVDDSDAKNYRESAEAWQKFTNTGSTDLASVDAPEITPGGKAVVATSLKVTISDQQWTQAPTGKLKVYYAIEEGSYGNITTSDWTEATSLPQELTLIKTSTVKAYAKYTASDGTETSSDTVSRTYFLLDANTTYLNTSESQEVGTTVKDINGITMTYGGIKVGSTNFKALSKNDNIDANTLGSIHTVSGKALYGTADVESELGNGSIGKNDKEEYFHCRA